MVPKMLPPKQTAESQSKSESQEASQEHESARIKQMLKLRSEKDKQRRQERRLAIEETTASRHTDLESRLEICVAKYYADVGAVRRHNLDQILILQEKKRALEAKIDKCGAELNRATLSAGRQVEVAVNGRLDEMNMA